MQEKRKFIRVNIPLEVSYNIKGKESVYHKTVTKDISAGGIRFTTEEELPKDTVLNLHIKIPVSSKPIPIKAKIVWSKKESAEKNTYDVGFEFMDIPEESKNEFFQYLCNLMYNQLKEFK